jgi:hypothetical protein
MTAINTTRPTVTEYTAAVERAAKRGVEVCGRGTRKSDGAPVYAVTSGSEANRWHLVVVEAGRLVCDCRACVYCCHRAAVHERMVADRAAAQMAIVAAAVKVAQGATKVAQRVPVRTDADRATAPLARDNRPFSLFKQ